MKYCVKKFVFAFLCAAMLACSEPSSQDHIAQAEQYLEQGEVKAAVIELKNALKKESDSAQARWMLGNIYLDQGDVDSAVKELEKAKSLGWNANDVQPALAEALLAQQKYVKLRELSLLNLKADAEARVLAAQAESELAQGEVEDAQNLLQQAATRAPGTIEVLMASAKIGFDQAEYAETLVTLEKVLAEDANFVPALIMHGDVMLALENEDEAVKSYSSAIKASPKDMEPRFKRALLLLQQEDFEAAQRDVTFIRRFFPKHAGASYLQGLLYYNDELYEKAAASLAIAEPLHTAFPVLLYYLGSAHFMLSNLDQAATFAGRFLNQAPDSVGARKLVAAIHLRQGEYREVKDVLLPLLNSDVEDVGALNIMANALLRGDRGQEGLVLLERVAQLEEASAAAQLRHGAGLLLEGQDDRAVEQFEKALALDPTMPQADVLLVLGRIQQQDFLGAIEAAEAFRDHSPDLVLPLNLLGYVYLQANQPGMAKQTFEAALAQEPGNPSAHMYLSQLALAQEDLATARQHCQAVLEDRPKFLPALLQMGRLSAMEDDTDAFVSYLTQAMDAHPTAIQPRIVMGKYYLAAGQPVKVAPLFITLEKSQLESPSVIRLQAMAHLANRSFDEAMRSLEQLLAVAPPTATVHHWMAEAAQGQGDRKRIKEELQRALALDENYLPSRIAVARAAREEGDFDAFDQHLERLVKMAPNDPDVLQLRARAAFRAGNTDAAVSFARQAFELVPVTLSVLDLAAYAQAAGDTQTAVATLQRWLDEYPDDVAVRLALAELHQLNQRAQDAIAQYEHIMEVDENNVVALNNLAWHLREKKPAQALDYAQRSAKMSPDDPNVLDTLAVVMYLNKDLASAKRTITRALKKGSKNPSIIYHGAMIDDALDNKRRARDVLQRLLATGEDFPERAAAENLLATLSQ